MKNLEKIKSLYFKFEELNKPMSIEDLSIKLYSSISDYDSKSEYLPVTDIMSRTLAIYLYDRTEFSTMYDLLSKLNDNTTLKDSNINLSLLSLPFLYPYESDFKYVSKLGEPLLWDIRNFMLEYQYSKDLYNWLNLYEPIIDNLNSLSSPSKLGCIIQTFNKDSLDVNTFLDSIKYLYFSFSSYFTRLETNLTLERFKVSTLRVEQNEDFQTVLLDEEGNEIRIKEFFETLSSVRESLVKDLIDEITKRHFTGKSLKEYVIDLPDDV